jgi:alcohol dehydrogenase class IV
MALNSWKLPGRIALPVVVGALFIPVVAGCWGGGRPEPIILTEPQKDAQKGRTQDEEIAYFIQMAKREGEGSEGKVKRAITYLTELKEKSAIPTLEQVAMNHPNGEIQKMASEAAEKIKAATKDSK